MDPLKEMAWALPDAVALETPDGRWTHGELDREVDALARRLLALGAGPRVRVAALLPLRLDVAVLIHAVPRTGAVLSPLNPRWTPRELRPVLEALRPVIVVCDGSTEAFALEALSGREREEGPLDPSAPRGQGGYRLLSVDPPEQGADGDVGGVPYLGSVEPSGAPLPGLRNPDVSAVLWTSGSSGRSRGVELTRDNLLVSARSARKALDLRTSDAWLATLSPAHVGGLATFIRAPVVGCRVLVHGDFSSGLFNTVVDSGAVTHASLVPTMLRMALDDRGGRPPPERLRCVLLGGAPAPQALLERARATGFPVAVTYGLTEASSQVATAPPELVRRKPGTVGEPLPGVQVRVPVGGGEIRVRGPVVGLRYLGSAIPLTDEEGWLRTGDLGRVDDEGHLWITGRLSERIISGGTNVDPAEVEAVLRSHPDVADAVVLGAPDPVWGERVVAYVVPAPLSAGPEGWERLIREVEVLARRELAPSKRPREFRRLEALPLGPNGKVDRRALAARLGEDRTPSVPSG